jgi:hypothetical protein
MPWDLVSSHFARAEGMQKLHILLGTSLRVVVCWGEGLVSILPLWGNTGDYFRDSSHRTAAHLHWNSGHSLSQLAWVSVLHETQCVLSLTVHSLVLCLPLHVPQVLLVAVHAFAKCPHFLHFIHCIGSCLSQLGQIQSPHMYSPSLMQMLAVVTSFKAKMVWAALCSGALL